MRLYVFHTSKGVVAKYFYTCKGLAIHYNNFMKYSELKRKLSKAGCEFLNHGKEHDTWYSPITKKRFRVPRHDSKEVATGTLLSIRKDSGVKL